MISEKADDAISRYITQRESNDAALQVLKDRNNALRHQSQALKDIVSFLQGEIEALQLGDDSQEKRKQVGEQSLCKNQELKETKCQISELQTMIKVSSQRCRELMESAALDRNTLARTEESTNATLRLINISEADVEKLRKALNESTSSVKYEERIKDIISKKEAFTTRIKNAMQYKENALQELAVKLSETEVVCMEAEDARSHTIRAVAHLSSLKRGQAIHRRAKELTTKVQEIQHSAGKARDECVRAEKRFKDVMASIEEIRNAQTVPPPKRYPILNFSLLKIPLLQESNASMLQPKLQQST